MERKTNQQQLEKYKTDLLKSLSKQAEIDLMTIKNLVASDSYMEQRFNNYYQCINCLGVDDPSNELFINQARNDLKNAAIEEKVIFALTSIIAEKATQEKPKKNQSVEVFNYKKLSQIKFEPALTY